MEEGLNSGQRPAFRTLVDRAATPEAVMRMSDPHLRSRGPSALERLGYRLGDVGDRHLDVVGRDLFDETLGELRRGS